MIEEEEEGLGIRQPTAASNTRGKKRERGASVASTLGRGEKEAYDPLGNTQYSKQFF